MKFDGSANQGTSCQTWQPQFDPCDPYGKRAPLNAQVNKRHFSGPLGETSKKQAAEKWGNLCYRSQMLSEDTFSSWSVEDTGSPKDRGGRWTDLRGWKGASGFVTLQLPAVSLAEGSVWGAVSSWRVLFTLPWLPKKLRSWNVFLAALT